MSTSTFDLGTILSIITGRLVSPRGMDGIYQILNHMTGDNLMTHQLPRACGECTPALLAQHPQLGDVQVPDRFDGEAHIWRWLAGRVDVYGAELPVAPLSHGDHTVIDPIAELRMMAPHAKIIAIEGS